MGDVGSRPMREHGSRGPESGGRDRTEVGRPAQHQRRGVGLRGAVDAVREAVVAEPVARLG